MASPALRLQPVDEASPPSPLPAPAKGPEHPSGKQGPDRSRLGKVLWVLAVVVAFGTGWLLAGGKLRPREKEALPPGAASASRDPAEVMVTMEPVSYRPVQRAVEGVGTMHGFEEVTLSTKTEGRVRQVHHDVADLVKPGEVLLEIDPIDHELAAQQAERSLQVELAKLGLPVPPTKEPDLQSIPSVMQAKARLEHLKAKMVRGESLLASRAISVEEVSTLRADLGVAEAEYANQLLLARSVLATIQMKQSALAITQQQLKDTQVRVPTSTIPIPGAQNGVTYAVTHRTVSEGTLVRPGTEVYKLVINQTLKLRVPVPERYSNQVRLGQKADVHTASFARPFAGVVTRINPAVESTTRTFEVEIQIPNPKGELRPGSFAKALIFTQRDAQAATVPLSAIVHFAGIDKIFLAENGRAKAVEVTLGVQTTEWVEITSPALPRGAQVITSGQTALAADTPISLRAAKD